MIEGGPGIDDLDGGTGTDTVSYRNSPSSVTVTINEDAFKGDAAGDILSGFENIIGSAYDDILTGNGSDNTIEGLAGADTLDGDGGNNTLSYESSNAGVTINLERGTGDFDATNNTIMTSSGGHAGGDKVKFSSFVHIIGSAHRDTLTGDNNANTLKGGGGNDTLNGDDGDDTLDGGPGGDTLDGGDGDMDTATYADATAAVTIDLSGSTGRGTSGDARRDTYKDIEKFVGSAHDDTFIAGKTTEGKPPDDFNGGGGTDTVSYERSIDAVEVNLLRPDQPGTGDEDNYAKGDTLTSIENIIGSKVSSGDANAEHDKLTGDSEANVIDGRGGNDTLVGNAGNDTLIGGRGNDTLTGNTGADTFKFASGDGLDIITDFNRGEKDKIDLSAYRSLVYITEDANNNLVIDLPSSNQITLNVTVASLMADDVIFYNRDADNTLTGDNNDNRIWGGKGKDKIDGRGGMDTLEGGEGNDEIKGGDGNDILNGNDGDDTLEGGAGADELVGGPGTDTLSYSASPRGASDNNRSGVTVVLNTSASGAGTHADGDNIIRGFENLTGSRYDDELIGDVDNNIIKGGSGNDTINGSSGGTDTLEGGPGGDTITGDSQDFLSYEGSSSGVRVDLSDTTTTTIDEAQTEHIRVSGGDASGDIVTPNQFWNIIGSRGSDTLTGDDNGNELDGRGGNDTLTGNDGADALKGGDGRDTLKGGEGNDTLDGGPGADNLDGGGTETLSGTDIATYASAIESVTVDLSGGNRGRGDAAGDTFTGIEQYVGSDHPDTFISGKDADNINGGTNTNVVVDDMDTVSYERSEEAVTVDLSISGSAQSIVDTVNPAGSYARGDILTNIENVIGSNKDDDLTAGDNGSVIDGGRGDDDLSGGSGSDTFRFASGDGDDEVFNFILTGNNHDRIDLSAFSGIASIDDLEISSVGVGNANTEIDLPGGGEITLYGVNSETDPLTADNFIFHDRPKNGTSSSNVLEGDLYNNTMDGQGGDDRMYGEAGRDTMKGGPGDDEMYGGEDKDTLNGGEGDDLMDGGPGVDTFVFEPGNGNDYIMDFTSGVDKIDLSAFVDETSTALILVITDSTEDDDNHVIELPDGGTITVLGVGDYALNNSDFMLP